MRYAILSDIHGNWPAWRAVLHDVSVQQVDALVVLGDVVGYGADPGRVLNEVYRHAHGVVMGNHEAALTGLMPAEAFNAAAREAIHWTRQHLVGKALRILRRLPLALEADTFLAVHGTPLPGGPFEYMWDEESAAAALGACAHRLIFCGHTHVARIFVSRDGGRPHGLNPMDFCVEARKRYVVDVGSVGLPRDGDPRASYCLYDDATGNVFFRRVAYDVEQFLAGVREVGLPVDPVSHLTAAERTLPPVREWVDFRPPAGMGEELRSAGIRRVIRPGGWQRSLLVTFAAVAACILAAVGIVHISGRSTGPRRIVQAATEKGVLPAPASGERLELPFVSPPGSAAGSVAFRYWSVALDHPRKQQISRVEAGRVPVAVLESRVPARAALESVPVRAVPGARFTVALSYRAPEPWSGSVRIVLVGVSGDNQQSVLAVRELDPETRSRWRPTSATMPKKKGGLPGSLRWVRARIEARCTGTVEFREMRLIRRE